MTQQFNVIRLFSRLPTSTTYNPLGGSISKPSILSPFQKIFGVEKPLTIDYKYEI